MSDLFDAGGGFDAGGPPAVPADGPLAARMRPRSLAEVHGQQAALRPGSPLRRLIEGAGGVAPDGSGASGSTGGPGASGPVIGAQSAILWGPPGTGKTTLAHLVAGPGRRFVELSAVSAGVKDVRAVIEQAVRDLGMYGRQTVLFLDEIHGFSKAQQDALLPAVENRTIILVAATTENPSFSVIAPLLSRSMLVRLESLQDRDVVAVLEAALREERGLAGRFALEEPAQAHLVRMAGGDARRALTFLEAAVGVALDAGVGPGVAATDADGDADGEVETGPVTVTLADVEQAVEHAAVRYDRAGDQHYDVASAFIKSMRGSDVDAALHYLARMLEAGEDPRFIARRIVICASEDVGMADPTALQTAVAALHAVAQIGMPEARIVLGQAVVHIAVAPKSNASYRAVDAAIADVRAGLGGAVPAHLRGTGYAGARKLGHGVGYVYAHDEADGVAAQVYLPEDLADRADYYHPSGRGFEERAGARWQWLRERLGKA